MEQLGRFKSVSRGPKLTSLLFLLDDAPNLEPVVPKSSSPGLVQSEAPVERLESSTPVPEPCSSVEPELPSPSTVTAPTTLPLSVANKSERPSARESTPSASSPSPSVGDHNPSLPQPQTPCTDKTPDATRTLASSPAPAPKALNGLADSGPELDSPAHEPPLLSAAAIQASASAYAEASLSSESLPPDARPEVPIAAALTPMAPVAVVPVTLTSSPVPALPVLLPPGLPPLVRATAEVDELNKSLDTKELAPRAGAELQAGVTDGKIDPQQQTLPRKGPPTGTGEL